MANPRFAAMSDRFVLLANDSRNGRSTLATEYDLPRNRTHFMVIHPNGEEIGRLSHTSLDSLNEDLIKQIIQLGERYVPMRDSIRDR